MSDAQLVSKLTAIFKNINAKGDGIWGQRPIDVTEHAEQLADMEFNINRSFVNLCSAPFMAGNVVTHSKASVTLTELVPADVVKIPFIPASGCGVGLQL
jgi:hypothetical protein